MKIQSKLLILYSRSQWSQITYNSKLCTIFFKLSRPSFYLRVLRAKLLWTTVAILACFFVLFKYYFTGIFYRPFEKDFNTSFVYPEYIEDFPRFIQNYKFLDSKFVVSKKQQLPVPTNKYYSVVEFVKTADYGCSSPIGLLIIVKSALSNFEKRTAVRSTWGHPLYLQNNSFSEDLPTKLVFIVGQSKNESGSGSWITNEKINLESEVNHDIISATFEDTYNNNTYKTISALRWAKEICSDFRYLFLVDDDMFISLKNLLLYLRNPVSYKLSVTDLHDKHSSYNTKIVPEKDSLQPESYKEPLYLGKRFVKGIPVRNQYGHASQWFVPLSHYPYNNYPPYITGMAILLSKRTVIDFVYASLFTRHLFIDDVYLGILAYKLKINATQSDYFIMLDKEIENPFIEWTEYMIAVHNYTPENLVKLWKEKILNTKPKEIK